MEADQGGQGVRRDEFMVNGILASSLTTHEITVQTGISSCSSPIAGHLAPMSRPSLH